MKVIILGCGRVGSNLANLFDSDGHDVSVIDKDPLAFERLRSGFSGKTLVGLGFDRQTLENAGIEEADAFIAAAKGDNHNAVSAFVARNVFGVPKVIARIYDSERARIYWNMGIATVAPVRWAVNQIKDYVLYPDIAVKADLGTGEVRIVECHCDVHLSGKVINDVEDGKHIKVVAVERKGQTFIPPAGFVLESGDRIMLAVDDYGAQKLQEILRG